MKKLAANTKTPLIFVLSLLSIDLFSLCGSCRSVGRVVSAFAYAAEGLKNNSRAGQIEHSCANATASNFLKKVSLLWRNDADMGHANSLHAFSKCNNDLSLFVVRSIKY